jgi:hypothetical protein
MKRNYVKAMMSVVAMETEQHLLASSTPEEWDGEMGYMRDLSAGMNKLA